MITAADYQATLEAIEQDLYGNARFSVQVELAGRQYSFSIWQGEQLPDQLIAYDTETAAIQANEVPQLALAAVLLLRPRLPGRKPRRSRRW